MDDEEDRRIHEHICGVTFIGVTGIEWICIKEPHDAEYRRKKPHKGSTHVMSNNRQVDFHYMVPRYPFRVSEEKRWDATQTKQTPGSSVDGRL